jgi:putative ATPase
MVEAMASDDDLLETADGDTPASPSARQRWANRSFSGDLLSDMRDRIFEAAQVQRDGLVLDLHARTGLLTFEALRRAPEGGVWAIAHDQKEFETVSTMAAQYDLLHRPTVLRSSLSTFDGDVRKAAGDTVAFDALVGRNILAGLEEKVALVGRALGITSATGCVVLAETVHSLGQRLVALLPSVVSGRECARQLAEAEESLFADANDPLVNWTPDLLEKECTAAFRCAFQSRAVETAPRRRLTPDLIDHWFRPSTGNKRKSLGARFGERFGSTSASELRRLLHAHLDNIEAPWKTVTAFMKITKARP